MPRTFSLKVFGCKVNQYNAERLGYALESTGYVKTHSRADVSVVYACSVTEEARRESISEIKKREKLSGKVFVTGCLGEKAGNGGEILKELGIERPESFKRRNRARPVVSVQEGCSSFCSYCIVNILRGRPFFRSSESVASELSLLETAGYSEAVIAGISLGKIEIGLGLYLKKLLKGTKTISLRIGSLNPGDIRGDSHFIEALADDRIMPHIHVSLQSGSRRVLRDMMRNYEPEEVFNLFKTFRELRQNPGLGIDIIAGFPTESRSDHLETVEFLKELSPTFAHVFPFSPRKGTLANLFPDIVGSAERTKRALQIRDIVKNLNAGFLKSLVGEQRSAVVEKSTGKKYILRTDNYVTVEAQSDKKIKNSSKIWVFVDSFDEITLKIRGRIVPYR